MFFIAAALLALFGVALYRKLKRKAEREVAFRRKSGGGLSRDRDTNVTLK